MAAESPSTPTGVNLIDELTAAIEAEADRLMEPLIAEMHRRYGLTVTGLVPRWIELGRFNAAFAALKVLEQRGLLRMKVGVAADGTPVAQAQTALQAVRDDLAETRRLLEHVVDTVALDDAWLTSQSAAALEAATEHLRRTSAAGAP